MQIINCNYCHYWLKTSLPFFSSLLWRFLSFFYSFSQCCGILLMFSHKKKVERSADPGISPDLSTYTRGMTVMNFRIWRKITERAVTPTHEPTFVPWHDNRKQDTDCVTTVEWFIDFVMIYWRGHKGITLLGNNVAVEKSKARTCRFVESKNGLSLSQIVALFLSVFVGCRWIRKRLSPHFRAMSPVAKTPWKAS